MPTTAKLAEELGLTIKTQRLDRVEGEELNHRLTLMRKLQKKRPELEEALLGEKVGLLIKDGVVVGMHSEPSRPFPTPEQVSCETWSQKAWNYRGTGQWI